MSHRSVLNTTRGLIAPSDEGLVVNIIRFSHFLRNSGISVTLSSVLEAVRGLEFTGVSNSDRFRLLLKMNFVCKKADYDRFDELFYRFWFFEKQAGHYKFSENCTKTVPGTDPSDELGKKRAGPPNPTDSTNDKSPKWVARYSPDALNKAVGPIHFTDSEALYASIKRWLRPLRNRLSRRYRYTIRGKEMTLKNVLRKNMQFGGELIRLDFKKKKLKKRKMIFLCDVSGSMDVYTTMLLQFIHAIKRMDGRTELFTFSTDLSRWTRHFESGDYIDMLCYLPEFVADWGGGTRIGHCLKQFNEMYGKQLLSNKTIVIIFSDGWDRGETEVLETQMINIHNRAYKVIWLNPLMGSREYQPVCRGMSTALPHVDYFMPMGDPKDMRFLIKTLEKLVI